MKDIKRMMQRMKKSKKRFAYDPDFAKDIFDFHYIARQRNARNNERFSGNSIYSMECALRKYSQYKGKIYCASEHGLPAGSTKDTREYKDNDRRIVCVMSKDRRNYIQPLTDKLLVPIGPSIMPYCSNIYSDFVIEAIKRNLGKTLLVFPQHSCADSECIQTADTFMEHLKELISAFHYNTVLVCLYYEDIYRGEFLKYRRYPESVIVTAGHKHNNDFADCLKTIINLSDHVVTQGYGSSAIYSMYLKKPVFYFPGSRGRKIENKGIFEDKNPWMQPYEDKLAQLSEISLNHPSEAALRRMQEEQWNWANKIYGFSEALTPNQIYELLTFSKAIERVGLMNDRRILKKLHSGKYENIKVLIEEALCCRAEKSKTKS